MGKSIEVGKASKERIEQRQQEWDKGKEEQAGRSAQHIYINVKHTQFFRTRMTPIKHSGWVFGESNIGKGKGKKFKTGTCVSWGRCTRGIQTPWSCRLHTHIHIPPFTHTCAEKEGRKANFSAHSTFVPSLPDVLFPYLPTAQEIYLLLDPVSLKSSTNSLRPSPATTT